MKTDDQVFDHLAKYCGTPKLASLYKGEPTVAPLLHPSTGTNECDIIVQFRDGPNRLTNLMHLLSVLNQWSLSFAIILVEQDRTPKIDGSMFAKYKNLTIRYHFLNNPHNFNKGWAYNCAVTHFTNRKTIVFCDIDMVPDQHHVLYGVDQCNTNKSLFCSPYNKVCFTTETERGAIIRGIPGLTSDKVKERGQVTTFSGGIMICNREKFLELGGYEEFNGYGFEDRAFDLIIDRFIDKDKLLLLDDTCIHLHHLSSVSDNTGVIERYFKDVYRTCNGRKEPKTDTWYLLYIGKKRQVMGDPDYYVRGLPVSINLL